VIELAIAIGNVYLKNGNYDRAEQDYLRALAMRRGPIDDLPLAGAQANLGGIAAARGRYREALDRFRLTFDALVSVYGPRHPNVAGAAINVGSAYAELGDLEAARAAHRGALEVLEDSFGPEHPSLAPALRMLAWNGLTRREFAEALPYAERALGIAERESGPRSESTARSLSMLASINIELDRTEQASALSARALDIARITFGAEHPTLAQFENDCGIAATERGDDEVAREHYARAIALRERALGPLDAEIGRAWSGIAELELKRGRVRPAIAAASKAHAIANAPGNEHGGAGPEAAFLLARALVTSDDAEERKRGRELAEQASTGFLASGPGWRGRADEVTAWLAKARRD
jgi:tetratricopeptide (TPR) repeat protein